MPNLSKRVSTRNPERAKKASISNDRLVSSVRQAELKSEVRRKCTCGIYTLKTKDSVFGFPFFGFSDSAALAANKELLPMANLYKLGDYCRIDGKIHVYKTPKIVLDK